MKTLSTELGKSKIITDRDKAWNDAVEKCRNLVRKITGVQFQVAEIAVEVCEIIHGGAAAQSSYTLKKFSEDVGIAYRTLHRWVREYRDVYLKLEPSQQEVASRTIIRDVISRTEKGNRSEKDIRSAFDNVISNRSRPDDSQAYDDVKKISNIEFRVTKGWNLQSMERQNIEAIYLFAKSISSHLEIFLEGGEFKSLRDNSVAVSRVKELIEKQELLN